MLCFTGTQKTLKELVRQGYFFKYSLSGKRTDEQFKFGRYRLVK